MDDGGTLIFNHIVPGQCDDINRLCAQEQDKLDRVLAEHHYVMQQEYYDQFRVHQ